MHEHQALMGSHSYFSLQSLACNWMVVSAALAACPAGATLYLGCSPCCWAQLPGGLGGVRVSAPPDQPALPRSFSAPKCGRGKPALVRRHTLEDRSELISCIENGNYAKAARIAAGECGPGPFVRPSGQE